MILLAIWPANFIHSGQDYFSKIISLFNCEIKMALAKPFREVLSLSILLPVIITVFVKLVLLLTFMVSEFTVTSYGTAQNDPFFRK